MYLILKGNHRLYANTEQDALKKAMEWSRPNPKLSVKVFKLVAQTKEVVVTCRENCLVKENGEKI